MRQSILFVGPLAALAVGMGLVSGGSTPAVAWTAGVTVLTALWWVFEPIPLPATSLLPIAIFPLVGVLPSEKVGAAYGHPLILLLLGGMMLSSALEKSGAHRRMALNMVALFGGASGRRLVLGFMVAAAFLSMWISNMATSLMLLPIVLAVLEKVTNPRLRVALLLGVAYACSVGGTGTPIGTPPNLICINVYKQTTGIEPTFTQWMAWALPIVVVMIPLVAIWLTRNLGEQTPIELPEVGPWRTEEVRTLAVFVATALLWVTRKEPWGGWTEWLDLPQATDGSVALLAVVVMFLIPNGHGGKILDWKTAGRVPWGILLLFSAGIVIARAFVESGLSDSLGSALAALGQLPTFALIALMCLAVTFLTEITSNTATANLLMPILAAAAVSAELDPRVIMVPAAISCSFAFMLPAATGPNAVIFSSEQISIREMAREGFALNVIGAVVVSTICYFMFG